MSFPLLARDVMRIGVLTCQPDEPIERPAAQRVEHGWTAVTVRSVWETITLCRLFPVRYNWAVFLP